MTYRSDLDALRARERALANDLTATQRERDEVGRRLAEALERDAQERREIDCMPRSYRRVWLALGGVLVAAGLIAATPWQALVKPITPGPLHNDQIRGAQDAAARASEEAFQRELTARRLSPVTLEVVTLEVVDPELETIVAWTPFVFERDGRARSAISDEVVDGNNRGAPPYELVVDASGGIWRVERVPRPRIVGRYEVDECNPGDGLHSPMQREPRYERRVWLLAPGQTYRGIVQISYDAPTLDLTFMQAYCPQPA